MQLFVLPAEIQVKRSAMAVLWLDRPVSGGLAPSPNLLEFRAKKNKYTATFLVPDCNEMF